MWSTFLLDVRILFHCTFILMILTFTAISTRLFTWDFSCPGEMLSLRRHLEDFGLLYLHWVHGWLDTCVRNLFTGSLLDPVLRFFPTAECRNCVSSTCCANFGTLTIFSTCSFCTSMICSTTRSTYTMGAKMITGPAFLMWTWNYGKATGIL